MIIVQKSKVKSQNYNLKFKIFAFCVLVLSFACLAGRRAFCVLRFPVIAISPTPTIKPITATPILSATPSASPSASPTGAEEEKVKEIREAIKEKVEAIKDKIEKKAYVGEIAQITDSTITVNNFRGKQRVRITEETIIIGANKKEVKTDELAVGDKVIALGILSANDILEAKRVIVVPKPKTVVPKRLSLIGTITEIDVKNASITVGALKNLDQALELKIDKTSSLILQSDLKANLTIKNLKNNQNVIIVYSETTQGNPTVKSLFLLP